MNLKIEQLLNNIDQAEVTITNSLLNDSLYTITSDDEYYEYDISERDQSDNFRKKLKSFQIKNYDSEHELIKLLANRIKGVNKFDIKYLNNAPYIIHIQTYDSSNKYDLRFDDELDILLNKLIELINQQNKES